VSAQTKDVADQGGLAGAYTPMSAKDALVVLREHFGLSGDLKRFDTEKDDTFRVVTADSRKFVLKIANRKRPLKKSTSRTEFCDI